MLLGFKTQCTVPTPGMLFLQVFLTFPLPLPISSLVRGPLLHVPSSTQCFLRGQPASVTAHRGPVNLSLLEKGVEGPCQGGTQVLCDLMVQLTLHVCSVAPKANILLQVWIPAAQLPW